VQASLRGDVARSDAVAVERPERPLGGDALAVALAAGTVVLIFAGHLAIDRGWMQWGPSAPIALRAFGAAIALAVGVVRLAAYRGRRAPAALIVGAAFLGVGVLQTARTLISTIGVHIEAPLYYAASIKMGWAQSTYLAVVLILGTLLVSAYHRRRGERPLGRYAFVGLAIALGVIAMVGPWFGAFPGGIDPDGNVVARPAFAWTVTAHLFLLTMLWRRPDVGATPEGRWLSFGVYVSLLDTLLVAPFWSAAAAAGTSSFSAVLNLVTHAIVGGGVVVGMVALARAEAASADRERAQQREQARIEAALARQAARLQHANEELAQYAYLASHDLQEPLRMVTSYLQLVERRYREVLDDEGREFMRFAVEGALRMKRLTNDLLVYSQVSARPLEPVESNAASALAAARDNLAATVAETRATITHDDLPTVPMAEVELVQLFQNLIGNALKFAREGVPPAVHVAATREGDAWHFTLRDNGIGIDTKYHDRVFAVFQRLHASDAVPGSGIGLALCRKIVERHGGRIWFESTPGEGTVFHWTIPARFEPPPRDPDDEDPELADRVTTLIGRARELA
jgi:signal transduction histidine kinase